MYVSRVVVIAIPRLIVVQFIKPVVALPTGHRRTVRLIGSKTLIILMRVFALEITLFGEVAVAPLANINQAIIVTTTVRAQIQTVVVPLV